MKRHEKLHSRPTGSTLNRERSTYHSRETWGPSRMATDIQQVTLSPADIPGADLSEPLNRHAVPDLRWWLLCRGIKVPTSWKKKQLVNRYVASAVLDAEITSE